MNLNKVLKGTAALAATVCTLTATAQTTETEKVSKLTNALSRLSLGGYGEVALSRNFYSDNSKRYVNADEHKNDPSHGRFDIPHVVINIGYDFGRGWSMGSEIEFEHGGSGSAYELEYDEFGEWEHETEKGGEVELEQFWIQKSFAPYAILRAGHIVVPVGLNNAHHEPLNFFTVYRPEGENTIMPSTWHQTGISFWGRTRHFRYEAQLLAGLNADQFTNTGWINKGAATPLEFEVANKYGVAARLDNYSVPGLRLGLSAYYGHTIGNSAPREASGITATYKGAVFVGSFDFTYNAHNWIVRGQADYGHLGDAEQLANTYNRVNKQSPYHHTTRIVSSRAYAVGIEAGYDIFSQIHKTRAAKQKLYIFGRYEQYNPYAKNELNTTYDYTEVKRMAAGINYYPLPQVCVKAEYSQRFLKSKYNNEPSVSLGVAYAGWFL